MDDRRTLLTKLAAAGVAGTASPYLASPLSAGASGNPTARDVRAFGARGDGRTDDTAAFNAATGAAGQASGSMGTMVYVPPGRYRIDGTVFVRKGQALIGGGDATVIDASKAGERTLVLGRGRQDRDDPGGAPVTVAQMRFLGGSGSAPLIHVPLQGFCLRDLFISAAGTAVEIEGADGIVSNIIIDQALNGIVFRDAHNVVLQGLVSYMANFAVTIDRGTSDVALGNMILSYSSHASILFQEGAQSITSLRIANTTFVSSIAYKTFIGHVHARSQAFDAQFADCVFRNWPGHAIVQGAGSGADLSFADCTFDGMRSRPDYNASASAKGVQTGADGRFHFSNCRFRNLAGEVVRVGPGLRALTMTGGAIERCADDPVRFDASPSGRIRLRSVDGFGRQIKNEASSSIVLPWWGTSSAWRVSATRRGAPGGLTTVTVVVTGDGKTVTCDIGDIGRYGAAPVLVAGLGAAPGGLASGPFGDGSGTVCLTAAASAIDWSADTIG